MIDITKFFIINQEQFNSIIDFLNCDLNPIDKEYYLEVSSVGLERELKNIDEIKSSIGKYINVKTYEKIMVGKTGVKEFEGHLLSVEDNLITMNFKWNNLKKKLQYHMKKLLKYV